MQKIDLFKTNVFSRICNFKERKEYGLYLKLGFWVLKIQDLSFGIYRLK